MRVVDIKWDDYVEEPYFSEKITLDLKEYQNYLKATEGMNYVFNFAANMGGIGFITTVGADVMFDNVLTNSYIIKAYAKNKVKRLFFLFCLYLSHV